MAYFQVQVQHDGLYFAKCTSLCSRTVHIVIMNKKKRIKMFVIKSDVRNNNFIKINNNSSDQYRSKIVNN